MKLSLDELKVDSYAVQVSESELADVKGGSAWLCVDLGIALAGLVIAGYSAYTSGSGASGGSYSGGSGSSGGTTTYIYGADSVRVTTPNGTTTTYYGVDSLIQR